MPTPGYYSLIQFCPDTCRLEAANIGVVLFCPDQGFLDLKVSSNNDRVRSFFGLKGVQLGRLDDARRALESRLRTERERFQSLDDLVQFNRSLGGNLLVTDPRPVKVYDAARELDNLFSTLVGSRETTQGTRSELRQALRQALDSRPSLKGKLLYDQKVRVPVAGTLLSVPVAFLSGTLNLIHPLAINRRTVSQARDLALDGDLLRKHSDDLEVPTQLWIALGNPVHDSDEERQQQQFALKLFQDYNLPVYQQDRLDALADAVEASLDGRSRL